MLKRDDCVVVLAVALECTDGRRTAVDVGANVGHFTAPMARDFARVLAFEPSPVNAAKLRARMAEHSNIEIHECALSDRRGRCQLNGTKSRQIFVSDGDGCDRETLDHFNLSDVDVIKCDAEGHDAAVMVGAEKTIARCSPVIIVECDRAVMKHRLKSSPEEFQRMMQIRFNYHLCAHVGQDYVFVPRR